VADGTSVVVVVPPVVVVLVVVMVVVMVVLVVVLVVVTVVVVPVVVAVVVAPAIVVMLACERGAGSATEDGHADHGGGEASENLALHREVLLWGGYFGRSLPCGNHAE
jgi:predicted membrane metal-binding protein